LRSTEDNRLTLTATLTDRADLRYTPAGIPALDCTLHHQSVQPEAGGQRKVECEVHAVAFGDAARQLSGMPLGSAIRCEGFLARRYRTGPAVALHITRFDRKEEH
jgi:primosomal replication protein N